LTPKFGSLNNFTQEKIKQLLNILESDSDISSCLSNCSNQGVCTLKNQTYYCECNENFIGKSCQTDKRPCSQSNNCLNNGTCINSLDLTSSSCKCPENGLYYGEYCENKKNLCENVTCSLHGNCIQNQNETVCTCFIGFKGDECEIESNAVKVVKGVQWVSTTICIVTLVFLWFLFICSDLLSYFSIGRGHLNDDYRKKNVENASLPSQSLYYVP
jgi:hypothetical protein